MGKKDIKSGYCNTCQKEILNPSRKPIGAMQKVIWSILIVATLGIAAVILFIYQYIVKKKEYCPTCGLKLETKKTEAMPQIKEPEKPVKISVPSPSKQKTPKKAKPKKEQEEVEIEEESEEKKKVFCDYCGADLSEYEEGELVVCPNCGSVLN